jgi:hypothetical protein
VSATAKLRWLAAAAGVLGGLTSGCEDDAYCFTDCEATGGQGGSAVTSTISTGGGLFTTSTGGGGSAGCELTNGGNEICDGIDNNCDGAIDEGINFDSIVTCGTCDNNCYAQLLNADPTTITCDWNGIEGEPGVCAFGECAQDYVDLDGDGKSCEYYCIQSATNDVTCNNKDDDCDGQKDEDVDLCGDANNCGSCGNKCQVVHGTGQCVLTGVQPCTQANTQCQIAACDDDDNDGLPDWHDIDGSLATGCEYPCSFTNGGVEICGDGIDNDCDGFIDGADSDLSGDPQLGQPCFGDPDGLCATPAHQGTTNCVGQQVLCTGANVLTENDVAETCNGIDDDCDGVIDDNPTNAGGSCGQSNIFPCKLGTMVCQGGALVCQGAVNPGVETCNGIDDNCNGVIDDNPSDAGGACDVPPPPPPNATSPCMAGTLSCTGGVLVCQGSTGPTSSTDTCGVDANCDGQLTNQPNLMTNVQHCGSCGNDCYAGAVNSQWSCQSGGCVFMGCNPGFHDLDNDQQCEYGPCTVTGSEVCDGIDNDCNGVIDDNLTAPSPTQVCGVAPAAQSPECTTGVNVQCVSGSWQCTFPPGVCSPNCQSATEICDSLDNDCDGSINENVPSWGQACKSDDGLPPPGHGACQTQGTFVCNGPNAIACSAVKANCATLPGGCTELCDGVDNDCDGLIDETFLNKGPEAAHFVRPVVTRIATDRWIYSFEASRPDATATSAGTGNGYWCTGASCPAGIPPAPSGAPLDETVACSKQGVLPWFNVSPIEVEQTCEAMGGFVCDTSDYMTACETPQFCDWGYNPRGAACQSLATSTKYCNLAAFDFNPAVAGVQDGLLPVGSPLLANCWADWSALLSNTTPQIYDITGNLREITRSGTNVYPLMGGAYNTQSEYGAACYFDFYVVEASFKLLDTGFRCCFDSDPRL